MDYQSHMFKFAPLVAESFVMKTVGKELTHYRDLMNQELL